MNITEVYADEAGHSHFKDTKISLTFTGADGFLSELLHAKGIILRETDGNYFYEGCVTQPQYVVILQGSVEIKVSSGTKRIFKTGDILLMNDTTGYGHISKAVRKKSRKSLFIPI